MADWQRLSVSMFSPLGASKAARAEVRCYTEVPFRLGNGKSATRPDGLVQVSFGKSTWTALIEVKTGSATLDADQINGYWDVAREQNFDSIVTISNEIAPSKDSHPTSGLKVRSNSKVKVHHYSWTAILSMCEVIKEHRGVDDPDQAWILGELIRYLRHPSSGATAFDDMGPDWVAVRDAARDSALRKHDPAVRDVSQRWDQLLRFAAFRLEADIGQPVSQQIPAAQRDVTKRVQYLVDRLAGGGTIDGALRIPNTVGDLELAVDLRARRTTAAVMVAAPDDRGGRARCTWLANQLDGDVDGQLVIEAFARNARRPTTATLEKVRADKDCLLGEDRRDPVRFRLSLTREMGLARKTGRKAQGFIDSLLALITDFYGTVVQDLTPWTPKAPRMTRSAEAPRPDTFIGPDEPPALTRPTQAPAARVSHLPADNTARGAVGPPPYDGEASSSPAPTEEGYLTEDLRDIGPS